MAQFPEEVVHSNKACTNNRGVYDGVFHAYSPHGNPDLVFAVDLGRALPRTEDPAELMRWALEKAVKQRSERRQRHIEPTRVVAASITRLCFSVEHEGPSAAPADASRQRELVCNIFVAHTGAEPFTVEDKLSNRFDEHGRGTLIQRDGEGILPWHGLRLPIHLPGSDSPAVDQLPLKLAMELNMGGSHPVCGALRGTPHEAVIPADELWSRTA